MHRRLFHRLHSQKIHIKMLIGMTLMATAVLMLITVAATGYFSSMVEREARSNVQYTLKVVKTTFTGRLNAILKSAGRFMSADDTLTTLTHVFQDNRSQYVADYLRVQEELDAFIRSDSMIDTIFMVGPGNAFYAQTQYGLNHDISDFMTEDEAAGEGIRLLPVRRNPLFPTRRVIPMVLPISRLNADITSTVPMISGTMKDAPLGLFILLDEESIRNYLLEVNKNAHSLLYLADQQGRPISLDPKTQADAIAWNTEVMSHLAGSTESVSFRQETSRDEYIILSDDVGTCGLKLVSIVSKRELLSGIAAIRTFMLGLWFVSFLLVLGMSLLLSRFLTKPIPVLMNILSRIEAGTYDGSVETKYDDEMGALHRAINAMHATIRRQMDVIQRTERERARAEIDVLTAQINPHFIYNTLDCIQWEVRGGHAEQAAAMVESLGAFLRIGLHSGETLIPVADELRHTEEYVRIINYRSNRRIAFTSTVDERLRHLAIVKSILQPLAENAIRHGFPESEVRAGIIAFPAISVEVRLEEDRVRIEVVDNGRGIDIDRATAALEGAPGHRGENGSIGLSNICKRLKLQYGDEACIRFSTTPYFRNCVTIEMPALGLEGAV